MQPVAVDKWRRPWIGFQWLFFRRGPGATNHFEAGGFARSNDEVAYPNLMFHFLPLAIRYDGSAGAPGHGYQVHIGPMYSDARGSVKIVSTDPTVHPALRFNYLSTDQDRREWVEAIRVARNILGQPAFDPYNGGETSPGPAVSTDQEILDWVARDAETALHPSCTARMGIDDASVVDPADDARPRARRVARRGRLRHALRHQRQHLRPGDDGRREGRRPRSSATRRWPPSRSSSTATSRPDRRPSDRKTAGLALNRAAPIEFAPGIPTTVRTALVAAPGPAHDERPRRAPARRCRRGGDRRAQDPGGVVRSDAVVRPSGPRAAGARPAAPGDSARPPVARGRCRDGRGRRRRSDRGARHRHATRGGSGAARAPRRAARRPSRGDRRRRPAGPGDPSAGRPGPGRGGRIARAAVGRHPGPLRRRRLGRAAGRRHPRPGLPPRRPRIGLRDPRAELGSRRVGNPHGCGAGRNGRNGRSGHRRGVRDARRESRPCCRPWCRRPRHLSRSRRARAPGRARRLVRPRGRRGPTTAGSTCCSSGATPGRTDGACGPTRSSSSASTCGRVGPRCSGSRATSSACPSPPRAREPCPGGRFPGLLNALYVYAMGHPKSFPGGDARGMRAVAGAVQELAGVRLDGDGRRQPGGLRPPRRRARWPVDRHPGAARRQQLPDRGRDGLDPPPLRGRLPAPRRADGARLRPVTPPGLGLRPDAAPAGGPPRPATPGRPARPSSRRCRPC